MKTPDTRLGVRVEWTISTRELVDLVKHGNPETARALFPNGLAGALGSPDFDARRRRARLRLIQGGKRG